MLIFKTIKWKNFLSTGNAFTQINLNTTKKTLIVGTNGAGKSTLLDALSFVLFGKAYRNINKPNLINSINDKDCVVEVEFNVGSKPYTVTRGIKPGIFEIKLNGKLVNQSSHNKDYQKILEQEILKMNYRSFTQMVVLGSASYTPFMKLPTGQRREVIENLLDIDIFTKMNGLLKEKMNEKKVQDKETQYQIDIVNTRLQAMEKSITTLLESQKNSKSKIQSRIDDLKKKLAELVEENDKINEIITKFQDVCDKNKENEATLKRLTDFDRKMQWKINSIQSILKTVCDNDKCPSCQQNITDELKKYTEDLKTKELSRIEEKRKVASECIDKLSVKIDEFKKKSVTVSRLSSKISHNEDNMISLNREIENQEKEEDLHIKEKIKDGKAEIKLSLAELSKHTKIKEKNQESKKYDLFIAEMLKDSGIKTRVIHQYLPIINEKINAYLQLLDFFVLFNFDDTFTETLKSRHRDTFSYASFSEGEKMKIDLALLFTWRDVARLKNSVSTNLLILDETFDSSLDATSIDNLSYLINSMDPTTNVIVISHKVQELETMFDAKIEFVKPDNFSKIKVT